MQTPIIDFVSKYAASDTARFHMPGHKGRGSLTVERLDITEINGADDLRCPEGIILSSERNATELFGTAHTYYLTEGSTLGIKAMLTLAVGEGGRVLAARNAHKAFVHAAALLDLSVEWLYPQNAEHICKCELSAEEVRAALSGMALIPDAVYVTSPDYLGNVLDIGAIAGVCDEFDIPLLVDNAHGAYLNFLSPSRHPIALGATICCDSAHKTLPALTGAAYLHVSKKGEWYAERARSVISLFSSTSPSYITLQSLDYCNEYLSADYKECLSDTVKALDGVKSALSKHGIIPEKSEPLKLVLKPMRFGYTASRLAAMLREAKIEPEFVDCEYVVLMVSTSNTQDELDKLLDFFLGLEILPMICECDKLSLPKHEQAISIRTAVFAKSEVLRVEDSVGRVCSLPTVSCPPAIAIVVSGEVITSADVDIFKKYGIKTVEVAVL